MGTEIAGAIKNGLDPLTMIRSAASNLAFASREVLQTLTLLMGQNNQASFLDPKPVTRDAALQSAWFHLDRVTLFCDAAAASLVGASDPLLGRVTSIWIPAIKTTVAGINRTLAYADPTPQFSQVHNGIASLVGPHGGFDHSEWTIARAWWYMLDSLDEVIAKFPATGADTASYLAKGIGIGSICAIGISRFGDIDSQQKEIDTRALLSTKPAGPFGVQFWLLLQYGQVLTDFGIASGVSGPGFYQQLQDAIAAADGTYATARSKLTDSWRRMDAATWFGLLDFPFCSLENDPAGCAAQLPSQQQPPPTTTCPPISAGLAISGDKVIQGTQAVSLAVSGVVPASYSFFVNGVLQQSNADGTFTWNTGNPGSKTVTVTAWDAKGLKIVSVSDTVTVARK